jgi:hypothetical protein
MDLPTRANSCMALYAAWPSCFSLALTLSSPESLIDSLLGSGASSGPTCKKNQLSSCYDAPLNSTRRAFPSCGIWLPKNCRCFQQCRELSAAMRNL